MKVKSIILACCLIIIGSVSAKAQTENRTVFYNEHDGLSQRHITQILQDHYGFIWLSTWNGLDRFDGKNFVTFKSRPGDGVNLPSDRFRKIAIDYDDPNVLNCLVDNTWFRFSILTGKFSPVSKAEQSKLNKHYGYGYGKFNKNLNGIRFNFVDKQKLQWSVLDNGISLTKPSNKLINTVLWPEKAEVKSIFKDSQGQIWVASKDDKTVRIYQAKDIERYFEASDSRTATLPKAQYLTTQGKISPVPVSFLSPIYCISEVNGEIWLGSKPNGLYRLTRIGNGFKVRHYSKGHDGMPSGAVYDIKQDRYGRVWLATLDAGIVCLDKGKFSCIRFGKENRARRLLITQDNVLLATTTEGLLVADINPKHKFRWKLHQREPKRVTSLSTNSCMDIVCIGKNRYFVSTESGGINEITSKNILSSELSFKHYDSQNGLGSDIILSMSPFVGADKVNYILAVSDCSFILLNTTTGESREFARNIFEGSSVMSDARPLMTGNGWIMGLDNGIALVSKRMLTDDDTTLPLVLTSITIENQPTRYTVNQLDEIRLNSDERTIHISFATLDYRDPLNISYAYKVDEDDDWHYLGNSNDITLSELSPGEYNLQLRSTNAMGKWNPQIRTLRIVVEPKFVETIWFDILILLFVVGLFVAIFLTRRYIHNIKLKQEEILKSYLSLLSKQDNSPVAPEKPKEPSSAVLPKMSAADKALMDRVTKFVAEHLSDSDVSVDDMASAAAVSKSGLNRKMKSIVGMTPANFLREVRINAAKEMLLDSSCSISEIAYKCGFAEPKYFSRVFLQVVGKTPTEFRNENSSVF